MEGRILQKGFAFPFFLHAPQGCGNNSFIWYVFVSDMHYNMHYHALISYNNMCVIFQLLSFSYQYPSMARLGEMVGNVIDHFK